MSYVPKKAPPLTMDAGSFQNFANWVEQELGAVSREMGETTVLELRVSYREPERPRSGMLVCADGAEWDPVGAGGGLHVYFNGAWVLVS